MSKKVMVYRVENRRGIGPYESGALTKVGISTFASTRHPMPYDDDIQNSVDYYERRYGFANLGSLRSWFLKPMREKLAKAGFKLSVLEVPVEHMNRGRRQLIFDRKKARLKHQLDLVSCK